MKILARERMMVCDDRLVNYYWFYKSNTQCLTAYFINDPNINKTKISKRNPHNWLNKCVCQYLLIFLLITTSKTICRSRLFNRNCNCPLQQQQRGGFNHDSDTRRKLDKNDKTSPHYSVGQSVGWSRFLFYRFQIPVILFFCCLLPRAYINLKPVQ